MVDSAKTSTWDAFCGFIEEYSQTDKDFALVVCCGEDDVFNLPQVASNRILTYSDKDANVILKAAGIALSGKQTWVIGSSALLASRCHPQIREALAIPSLPVRIAVYDGGLCEGHESASRHITEDIAIMRSIPNMSVLAPSDSNSLFGVARAAARLKSPVYIRLGQSEVPLLKSETAVDFTVGGARIIKDGSDVTICACGVMAHESAQAADVLERQGISAEVVECYSIKPFPEAYVLASVRRTGCCVVAEEHTSIGGLCGAVTETLSQAYPVPVRFVAIEDSFVDSGSPEELREYYGLTWKEVVNAASQVWALRRR